MASVERLKPPDFQVGWICTESKDLTAAECMLDEEYAMQFGLPRADSNAYILGRIGVLKVVLATLPMGSSGSVGTNIVAGDMSRTFASLELILLTGAAGAIPNSEVDVRLGDAVIAVQSDRFSGIVQYSTVGGIKQLNQPTPLPPFLLDCVRIFQLQLHQNPGTIQQWTSQMLARYPRLRKDY
ncbi:hypothetical protein LTR80_011915 [Exophiala xenobiotica]